MYGGSGVTPAVSRSSSTGPEQRLVTTQRPSPSACSQRGATRPPRARRRAPRRSADGHAAAPPSTQARSASPVGRRNSTSMRPPLARRKKLRAGNTRVSLRTSTSPARSSAGQLANGAVLDGSRETVEDEQAGRVARLDGLLGDELRRQLVVEVRRAAPPAPPPPPSKGRLRRGRPPRSWLIPSAAAAGVRAMPPTCSPRSHSTADDRARGGDSRRSSRESAAADRRETKVAPCLRAAASPAASMRS